MLLMKCLLVLELISTINYTITVNRIKNKIDYFNIETDKIR